MAATTWTRSGTGYLSGGPIHRDPRIRSTNEPEVYRRRLRSRSNRAQTWPAQDKPTSRPAPTVNPLDMKADRSPSAKSHFIGITRAAGPRRTSWRGGNTGEIEGTPGTEPPSRCPADQSWRGRLGAKPTVPAPSGACSPWSFGAAWFALLKPAVGNEPQEGDDDVHRRRCRGEYESKDQPEGV